MNDGYYTNGQQFTDALGGFNVVGSYADCKEDKVRLSSVFITPSMFPNPWMFANLDYIVCQAYQRGWPRCQWKDLLETERVYRLGRKYYRPPIDQIRHQG